MPLHLLPCSNLFNFQFFSLNRCFLLSLISWIKCPKERDIPLYPFEVYRVVYAFLLQGMQLPVAHLCTMPVCYTMTMIAVSCPGTIFVHSQTTWSVIINLAIEHIQVWPLLTWCPSYHPLLYNIFKKDKVSYITDLLGVTLLKFTRIISEGSQIKWCWYSPCKFDHLWLFSAC